MDTNETKDGLFEALRNPEEVKRLTRRLAILAVVSVIVCPLLLPADLLISRFIIHDAIPGDLKKAIDLSEIFGHGVGVAMTLMAFSILAPGRRWALPRLTTFAFGAGAIATFLKLFVIRARPYRYDLQNVTSSVVGKWTWDWDLQHVAVYDAGWRSFPSGHAATAFGLAFGLALLFPRGRMLFLTFAALAMIQRIFGQAHYASDIVAGIAIGSIWCFICIHPRLLGGLFEQIEPKSDSPSITTTEQSEESRQAA